MEYVTLKVIGYMVIFLCTLVQLPKIKQSYGLFCFFHMQREAIYGLAKKGREQSAIIRSYEFCPHFVCAYTYCQHSRLWTVPIMLYVKYKLILYVINEF